MNFEIIGIKTLEEINNKNTKIKELEKIIIRAINYINSKETVYEFSSAISGECMLQEHKEELLKILRGEE